jgi:two-component system, cell cycle sensor histidine kinase and response regulator CckA
VKRSPRANITGDHHAREVAHDFHNLLTAIIGAADAVLTRSGIDLESRADVANMREGALRGAALIQYLHHGADYPRTAPGLISVNETIRSTSRLLSHRLGANIVLTLDLKEPDGQVRAEASQLDRAILNLIANSRHAMPAGGEVTLGTECRVLRVADQRVPDLIPIGDYVVITVTDTGTGILDDEVPRIFDAGFSSRRGSGGSGLGLSSIRAVVGQCNGFLSVESMDGYGTRFEIYLPRAHIYPGPGLAEESQGSSDRRVVLAVDDDSLVRQVVERVMRRAGWVVLCVESGELALRTLKNSRFDLVISDVKMCGMDGLTLTNLALALQPHLAIILTSGYEFAALGATFGSANVTFLSKPYGQVDLLAAVARSCSLPPVPPE